MATLVDSSEDGVKNNMPRLMSVLLYALGALLLCRGVLDVLVWRNVLPLPLWLSKALSLVQPVESLRALAIWANTGVLSVGLGFWTLVTAFWVSRKMPGDMMMTMVVLTLSVLIGGMTLVRWIAFPSSFDPFFWPDYLQLLIVLLGVITTFLLARSTSLKNNREDN